MHVTEQDENKPSAETKTMDAPAAEKESPKKPAHKARARHSSPSMLLLLVIVIAGAVATGFFGFHVYTQQSVRIDELATQQSQLQSQNEKLKSQVSAGIQTLSNQQADLANNIETLRAKNQHLRKDWLILEAEYLLQLANYRLLFERDINTAIVALNSADMRLRDTGDPGVIGVRKVIAEAVQALKQVPQADLAGLSLSLSAINKDIETLPLNTPDPKSKQYELQRENSATQQVQSWSELPAAIWRDLKSLVVIRDHTEAVQPLLAPDQRFFLIENLRLQIEQARLAMLSGQPEVYKERIATAINWIETYFDKTSPHTQTALDTLKQVQASAIAPPLPDISKPYQALEQYRQNDTAAAEKK